MSGIVIEKVRKSFDTKDGVVEALKDVNLNIDSGDIYGIIGMSGAGKSTLVRCMNFLEVPTEGQVLIDGKALGDLTEKELRKQREEIGMIFQHFNLLMQKSVIDNVCFPLYIKGKKKAEARKRAAELLEIVGLGDRQNAYPAQLSGGQQQRVAIARALVKMPRILLLDEPLSNLDARLRLQTREEIRRIQKATGITTVFVTHDQEEAMSISDLIVVMKDGVVQQIGKPQAVYDSPVNLFVAKFLGTPPINVFDGEVKDGHLYIGEEAVLAVPGVANQSVTAAIRPEGFTLSETGALSCDLSRVEVMGRDISVVSTHPKSQNVTIRSIISAENAVNTASQKVRFDLKPNKVFLFHKETGARIDFG